MKLTRSKSSVHTNDQDSPNGMEINTDAVPSSHGRRKVSTAHSGSNGFLPGLKGAKGTQKITEFMSENSMHPGSDASLKELQIKLTRCDDKDMNLCNGSNVAFDDSLKQLDQIKSSSKTGKGSLKKTSKKNLKKLNDIPEVTENAQKDEDAVMCDVSDVVVNHSRPLEAKAKSATRGKSLKKNSRKNIKGISNISEEIEKVPSGDKFLNDYVTKEFHVNVERCDDLILKNTETLKSSDDSELSVDVAKKIKSVSSQTNKSSRRKRKNNNGMDNIPEETENMQSEDKCHNGEATEVFQMNLESCDDLAQKNIGTSKSSDESDLSVDAPKKKKSIPNQTGKGSKRKRGGGKQSADKSSDDEKPAKKGEDSDKSVSSKSSREKIPVITAMDFSNNKKMDNVPEKTENVQSGDKFHDAEVTEEAQMNLESSDDLVQKNIETSKSSEKSDLSVDAPPKIKSVPNQTGKGSKRKRGGGQQSADKSGDDEKPAKSAKKGKDSDKSKSSREEIPDVTSIDFSNDSKSPNGNDWNFKISSWNVNGIRAWLEKNGLSYLHHEKPDIICIQETKCSDDKLPQEVKEIEGYHTYWLSGDKDGYSGVGLLSKQEPIKIEYGIGISEHDNEGRVITAEYEKFYLVSTYVPNSGRKLVRLEYRMKWDKDFRAYLKKLDEKKPVILCGDLNVAHEEIDLANPKSNKRNAGFTEEERDAFSALLSEGFKDTFRHLYPDVTGAYTFWTYMMNSRAKNVGWRLDYFVISDRFGENLCDSVIRKDVMGSDHCPITLFLSV